LGMKVKLEPPCVPLIGLQGKDSLCLLL